MFVADGNINFRALSYIFSTNILTGKQSTRRILSLVLEPEFLGEPELVEGGIAGKLHHGRRPAHQDDVILPRKEQVLRDHVGVHEARTVLPS